MTVLLSIFAIAGLHGVGEVTARSNCHCPDCVNLTLLNVMNQSLNLQNSQQRIAYIEAGWHQDIVSQSRIAFSKQLLTQGITDKEIDVYQVPGSLEIPLQCKQLAQSGAYAAIVACGLIVDGGIYRHDFVASTVLDAMMQVQLETNIPVLSIVLTPHHFSGQEHHDFFFEHFKVKGCEAANACVQVLQNQQQLNSVRTAA